MKITKNWEATVELLHTPDGDSWGPHVQRGPLTSQQAPWL